MCLAVHFAGWLVRLLWHGRDAIWTRPPIEYAYVATHIPSTHIRHRPTVPHSRLNRAVQHHTGRADGGQRQRRRQRQGEESLAEPCSQQTPHCRTVRCVRIDKASGHRVFNCDRRGFFFPASLLCFQWPVYSVLGFGSLQLSDLNYPTGLDVH